MVVSDTNNHTSTRVQKTGTFAQGIIIGFSCVLIIQSLFFQRTNDDIRGLDVLEVATPGATKLSLNNDNSNNKDNSIQFDFPLAIPKGEAKALPSIRIEQSEEVERGIYGGKGDKKHLGGFTEYDGDGVSPAVWKQMITEYGVKSVIDVGCGKGVSTLWFHLHGAKVLCLEGSHDAVQQTLLPNPETQVVEHDFSRGPYWPGETYDAVWSVEFLEHVGRNFQYNYIQAFRKAALIFVSHSIWGGWHHVEVHNSEWWITRFESLGFRYDRRLTEEVKKLAGEEVNNGEVGPNGKPYNAQHIWLNMKVFINPAVAALPRHAHLFSEHGCFQDFVHEKIIHRECGTGHGGEGETKLPESFYPLQLTPEMDQAWIKQVNASFAASKAPAKK